MLVLSRKVGERIVVGDNITITVVRMGQGNVRIGIDAPDHMPIVREELLRGPVKDEAQMVDQAIELCDATLSG
ncbi:MAG TPA: carbon storage regulator [Pirellulales bacterium]|jgi:carbon storage regulator